MLLLHPKKSRFTLRDNISQKRRVQGLPPWDSSGHSFPFFHQDKRRIVICLPLNPLRGSSHCYQRLAHKDFSPQNVHPTPPSPPPLSVVRHHPRLAARQHLAVCQRRACSRHPRSGVHLRISFCRATTSPSQWL